MKFEWSFITAIFCLVAISAGCGGGNKFSSSAGGSTSAPEGTESSAGGGNAVVCFGDQTIPQSIRHNGGTLSDELLSQVVSVEMLDLYEAERDPKTGELRADRLIEIKPTESPQDYVATIASHAMEQIPAVYDMIHEGKNRFPEDATRFAEKFGLRKINDARLEHALDPKCVLVTMAAQTGTSEVGDLALDHRLYSHPTHSKQSQAVLLLHEYLYAFARSNGASDSRAVRKLLGQLLLKTPEVTVSQLILLVDALRKPGEPASLNGLTSSMIAVVTDLMDKLILTYEECKYGGLVNRAESELASFNKQCDTPGFGGCALAIARLKLTSQQSLLNDLKASALKQDDEVFSVVQHRWMEEWNKYSSETNPFFTRDWTSPSIGPRLDQFFVSRVIPAIGQSLNHPFCTSNGTDCFWPYFDRSLVRNMIEELLKEAAIDLGAEHFH